MATRTFLIVPRRGGRIREVRFSLWWILPVCIFLALGIAGVYYVSANYSPDQEKKQRALALRRENRALQERHNELQASYGNLVDRVREIKVRELEISKISGYQKPGMVTEGKRSTFLSFVKSPFSQKEAFSIDDLLESARAADDYYAELIDEINSRPREFNRVPSIWPLGPKHTFISFGFGDRLNPFTGRRMPHLGVDFPAPIGTRVFAAASGVAVLCETHKSFGKRIKIRHSGHYATVYAHLHRIKIRQGQFVKKGQVIGSVGNTGYTTGPHLHYEILFKGVRQDPFRCLFPLPDKLANTGTATDA